VGVLLQLVLEGVDNMLVDNLQLLLLLLVVLAIHSKLDNLLDQHLQLGLDILVLDIGTPSCFET
jgi:hypothetical protein